MSGTDFEIGETDPFAVSQESFETWLSGYTLPYAATNAGGKRLSLLIAFEPNGDEGANTLFKVVHGEKVVYLGMNLIEAVNRFNAVKDGAAQPEGLPGQGGTGEERWKDACNVRTWDETTQIVHLEGFVRDKGLFPQLATYAERAAKEEEWGMRESVLESVGYEFKAAPDQPDSWVWTAPSDQSAESFASKSDAVQAAWADAMQQTMAIAKVTAQEVGEMRAEAQTDLVESTLSGG